MKANELRIGNFVSQLYSFGCDGNKKPEWRIWELDLLDIQDVQSRPEIYNPIPLTEEWLVRFGFEKRKFSYLYGYGNFLYDYRLKLWTWYGIQLHDYLITYVHQLQNLYFALTGQELEISE